MAYFVVVVPEGMELDELMSVDEPVAEPVVEPVVDPIVEPAVEPGIVDDESVLVPDAPIDVPLPVEDEVSVLAVLGVVMLPLVDDVSALVVGAVEGALVVLDVVEESVALLSRPQAASVSAEAAIRARAAPRARGDLFIRDTP